MAQGILTSQLIKFEADNAFKIFLIEVLLSDYARAMLSMIVASQLFNMIDWWWNEKILLLVEIQPLLVIV